MIMKTIKNHIFFICIILVNCQLSIVNSSCTQGDLLFRGETLTGQVEIYPDMSTHTLPKQKYYFYNTAGISPCTVSACDGLGNFIGKLPAGTYCVIASNAKAQGVEYQGMDNYETAMAYATNLSTTRTETRDQKMDNVYRVVMEKLNVSTTQTTSHTPKPSLLTRTVKLNFTMDSELMAKVTNLSGTLQGVYPSVQLYTGKTIESEIARSPELYTPYTGVREGNHWVVVINLFGLCDPHGEYPYQNITTLELEMEGKTTTVDVDLSNGLSSVLEEYNGDLPIEVPVQINVELELVNMTVTGIVESWSYESNTGTEVVVPIE